MVAIISTLEPINALLAQILVAKCVYKLILPNVYHAILASILQVLLWISVSLVIKAVFNVQFLPQTVLSVILVTTSQE